MSKLLAMINSRFTLVPSTIDVAKTASQMSCYCINVVVPLSNRYVSYDNWPGIALLYKFIYVSSMVAIYPAMLNIPLHFGTETTSALSVKSYNALVPLPTSNTA